MSTRMKKRLKKASKQALAGKGCIRHIFPFCIPKYVRSTYEELANDEAKISMIKSMGFDSLRGLCCDRLPVHIISCLVELFDPCECCLRVDGCTTIPITAYDVWRVLGIPLNGDDVPSSLDRKKGAQIRDYFESLSFSALKAELVACDTPNIIFKQTFLLFILGSFLCPIRKRSASCCLLPAVSIASSAHDYNWCQFVLNWLIEEVRKYKSTCSIEMSNPGIGGCLYFLMIFYFDRVPCGIKPKTHSVPLVLQYTKSMIKERVRIECRWARPWETTSFASQPHTFLENCPLICSQETHIGCYSQQVRRIIALAAQSRSSGLAHKAVISSFTEDEQAVYAYCMRSKRKKEIVTHIRSVALLLENDELYSSMRERGWVSNFIVSFACGILNKKLEKTKSNYDEPAYRRVYLDPQFSAIIKATYPVRNEEDTEGIREWSLQSLSSYYSPSKIGHDISLSDMVFVPVIRHHHWFLMVFNFRDKCIDILDSLVQRKDAKEMHKFYDYMILRMQDVLDQFPQSPHILSYDLVTHSVPQQEDCHSCGIFMLKFMEHWEGHLTLSFSQDHISYFRKRYVVDWIFHEENNYRTAILEEARVYCQKTRKRARRQC